MEVGHALCLIWNDQRLLAGFVLCGDTCRAMVCVTGLRLNTAHGKHKSTRRVAPIRSKGQRAGNIKGVDKLARRPDADLVTQTDAAQGVVHERKTFHQRHAHVVCELKRRSARAAFLTVHHNEIRRNPRFQHGAHDAHEFATVTDTQLKPDRLSPGQIT